jgi:hypothetical protein
MYDKGEGTTQNFDEAFQYFRVRFLLYIFQNNNINRLSYER